MGYTSTALKTARNIFNDQWMCWSGIAFEGVYFISSESELKTKKNPLRKQGIFFRNELLNDFDVAGSWDSSFYSINSGRLESDAVGFASLHILSTVGTAVSNFDGGSFLV